MKRYVLFILSVDCLTGCDLGGERNLVLLLSCGSPDARYGESIFATRLSVSLTSVHRNGPVIIPPRCCVCNYPAFQNNCILKQVHFVSHNELFAGDSAMLDSCRKQHICLTLNIFHIDFVLRIWIIGKSGRQYGM